MRSMVRRNTGESYEAFLNGLATKGRLWRWKIPTR